MTAIPPLYLPSPKWGNCPQIDICFFVSILINEARQGYIILLWMCYMPIIADSKHIRINLLAQEIWFSIDICYAMLKTLYCGKTRNATRSISSPRSGFYHKLLWCTTELKCRATCTKLRGLLSTLISDLTTVWKREPRTDKLEYVYM